MYLGLKLKRKITPSYEYGFRPRREKRLGNNLLKC